MWENKAARYMRQRIYIDTSVIGGYYDVEFKKATRQLFERIADREFDVYFSEVNENFDTVAFFRTVKEKMAKATEKMTLDEKRNYWKLMREGKIKLS